MARVAAELSPEATSLLRAGPRPWDLEEGEDGKPWFRAADVLDGGLVSSSSWWGTRALKVVFWLGPTAVQEVQGAEGE